MNKFEKLIILCILLLALGLRLYKINNPIADWHSFRQADTAAVTRYYLNHGLDLLHPQYHDLSNIQSGQDNPQGYRMVEFPIYNLIHYQIHKLNSVACQMLNVNCLSIESAGRLTTIFASLFSLLFLYLIVKHLSGKLLAILSAFIFAVLPFNIYYSRVILPDPLMVTFSLCSIWLFIKYLSSSKKSQLPSSYFLLSMLTAASAILIKPTAIFLVLPICVLTFQKWGWKTFKKPQIYFYWLIAILPFILWRIWIQQYPAGIPVNEWLLNGDGIRLRPAWFRWLFYERLTKLILGGFGIVLFVLGIITKLNSNQTNKAQIFYLIWLLSGLLYLIIFATGNVRHDYYQIPLIPIVSIIVAQGLITLWKYQNFNQWLSLPLSGILFAMMIFVSWYQIKGYYQINNHAIIEAGHAADQLLPKDAKVIAPYFGDTAFLYQTNRSGWPLVTHYPIQEMINRGATHYISVNYDDFTNQLMTQYPIIKQTDKYIIINLTNSNF